MAQKVRCYAQTMPGVEEITWLEVRSRFPQARLVENLFAKDENGMTVFDCESSVLGELLALRTAEDVFVQALHIPKMSRGYRDLAQITEWVGRGSDFGQAGNHFLRYRKFSHYPSYQVVSRVVGKHEYKRREFETAVLKGMAARYPKWTPVAKGGEVELYANLLGSQLLMGFRLSNNTMRQRYTKTVEGALRPSVAGAAVFLTNPQPDDRFLDPFCGSGTLLLERQAAGRVGLMVGSHVVPAYTDAAWKNLASPRRRKLPGHILLGQWDARYLPLPAASINKLATYLPSSKQLGSTAEAGRLYPAFFSELERVLQPKGTAVLYSTDYDLVKEVLRRFEAIQLMTGYSVAIGKTWGRLYILEHL